VLGLLITGAADEKVPVIVLAAVTLATMYWPLVTLPKTETLLSVSVLRK
jgi:hypothetical protein